jgi:BCD family chlorophyll transporter-like MFS transporter
MGLWGAAQAAAFGLGGIVGTGASDLAHALLQDSRSAYVAVFAFQSLMFIASALVALRMRAGAEVTAEASTGELTDGGVYLKGGSLT